MSDTLNRYREAASGLSETTRKGVERIIRRLRTSRDAAGRLQQLVDRLARRSQQNRDALAARVRGQVQELVKRMGLATRADVERLQRQLANLRQRTSGAEEAVRETPGPAVEAARETAADRTAEKAAGQGPMRTRGKKEVNQNTTVDVATETAAKHTAAES